MNYKNKELIEKLRDELSKMLDATKHNPFKAPIFTEDNQIDHLFLYEVFELMHKQDGNSEGMRSK